MINKVNIAEKFGLFNEYWQPKIIGEVNNFAVKAVKVRGEFVWHHHESEDEMFLVIHGRLIMQIRNQADIEVNEGEFIIIPHGVEHRPIATEECHILLFEPTATLNTGNIDNHSKTVSQPDHI